MVTYDKAIYREVDGVLVPRYDMDAARLRLAIYIAEMAKEDGVSFQQKWREVNRVWGYIPGWE